MILVSQKKKGKKRDEKKALERHVDFIIRECDLFFLLLVLFSPQKKIRPVWWCGRIIVSPASKKAREKKRARRNGKFGESSSSSKARFVRRTFFLERRIKGRENSPLCFFFVIKIRRELERDFCAFARYFFFLRL